MQQDNKIYIYALKYKFTTQCQYTAYKNLIYVDHAVCISYLIICMIFIV